MIGLRSPLVMLLGALTCLVSLRCIGAHEGKPEIFAPGIVSGPAHDSAPAFTPDGRTVYFSRSTSTVSTIVVSRQTDGVWTQPKIASFSGIWSDMEPAMAPDGNFLVFASNRPVDGHGHLLDGTFNGKLQVGQGGNLWCVSRKGDGWSEAQRLPDSINRGSSIFAPSITADGSVYFMEPDAGTGKFRLYRSQRVPTGWQAAEAVSFSDGTNTDVDPAVAPDESFIVFGSGRAPARGMDLFISFRQQGRWSTPLHMGDDVNSASSDAEARLSPDHRTLYFSSDRTVPIQLPRTHEQAEQDLLRVQSWDNGLYNIWRVSLAPWLDSSPLPPRANVTLPKS